MTPDRDVQLPQLHQLARLYGVQLAYTDTLTGRPKRASPDALLAVLRALGAPVEGFQDVPAALRERRQALWQRVVEPVVAAWDGSPGTVPLRLPASWAEARASCFLQLESGEVRNWTVELKPLRARERVEVEGARYVVKSLTLPSSLPWGYHQLRVEIHGQSLETLLIGAPLHAYALPDEGARRWGVFLPLYALHSRRSPAGGDFSDLNALRQWAEGLGASTAGCLPLLAAFLDEPFAPSPYRPASCLFWNEFYLDVARIPELERSPAAQARLRSAEHRKELEALGAQPLVDYRRTLAWKRQVLEELARSFFAEPSPRQAPFERFRDAHPELEDYARFRAAVERQRIPWTAWPQPQRDGVLQGGDYDEEARRYHVYVQWQAQEQLQAVSEEARQNSPGLYLDLPLGVHPEGYDVWRYRSVFALGASGGAPPDDFFVKGQNWGFPPLHPEKVREQAHRYTIACLRHHCRKAGILRIDHVMSLHRLFWIPRGGEVSDGAYVRRPAEELYAILTLESHRNKTLIVGEDLGTVPRAVRQAMARHRIFRSYVLQFALASDPRRTIPPVPRNCLASFNTHDARPFAGFWKGRDIRDRFEMGLVDRAEARRLREKRRTVRRSLVRFLQRHRWLPTGTPRLEAIVRACLAYLGASRARMVLVNLEDLWGETEQQNTPGTVDERPNWRRKARYSFEAFSRMPQVLDALQELNRRRKRRSRDRGKGTIS